MIDPTMIEQDNLGILAGMYMHGQFMYGPVDSMTPTKKKKYRNWVQKHYAHNIDEFPQDIRECFAPDVRDDAVLEFLAACHGEMIRRVDQQKDAFYEATASLDQDVRLALNSILDEETLPPMHGEGDRCVMMIDDTPAFRRKLTLKGIDGITQLSSGGYMVDIPKIERTLERYIFSARPHGEAVSVEFSEAAIQVECFNCVDGEVYWDNPWRYLQMLAGMISYKAQISEAYCNDLERGLLPLLEEISNLNDVWKEEMEFTRLKALADDFGFTKITQVLCKLEAMPGKKRESACRRVNALLCHQEYEPLWREIFEKIKASQAEYPRKTDICCDAELLKKKRSAVQKIMESHGFYGEYPDFTFHGAIFGLHLESSYNQSYFVAGEKNVVSHIHCVEGCDSNGTPAIQFLCGIEFLRKDEQPGDIYSCLFNARGRRLYRWVLDYRLLYSPAEERDMDEQLAQIAVKKARLQRLNRQEKKVYHAGSVPGWGLFWWILLFGGALFGILMTLAMMFLSAIVIVLFGGVHELPQFMAGYPWGYMLLFCWLSYGVTMGVITLLATKK